MRHLRTKLELEARERARAALVDGGEGFSCATGRQILQLQARNEIHPDDALYIATADNLFGNDCTIDIFSDPARAPNLMVRVTLPRAGHELFPAIEAEVHPRSLRRMAQFILRRLQQFAPDAGEPSARTKNWNHDGK